MESCIEDNNDWLYGKENGSSVECSISRSVTIGSSTVIFGLITCARFWIRGTVTSEVS